MGKLLWSVVVFMLLLSGCGWNGTPTREDDFSPVTSITISADYSTIAKGTSVKLKATGHVSGLGTRDITDKVTWLKDTTGFAEFNSTVFPSRVTGVAAGSAVVTATLGTLSASYTLTVTPATISSIAVTPAAPSVPNGLTQQFKAIGTFSDNTTRDITLDAAWSSGDPGVATISTAEISNGLAKAVAIGVSTITATFGTVPGAAEMTVTVPVVQSIAVSPVNPTLLSLSTQSFTATGTYSDGSTADITSGLTWSSSDTTVATINSSGGLATTLAQGSATISAALGNISGTAAITVTGGNLSSIAVTPATTTLAKDTTTRIKAVGTFTFGSIISTRDITGAVTWTTADSTLATVTSGSGNLEWLKAVAVTPGTTITATAPTPTGKTGTAILIVTPATLTSIELSPSPLGLTAGTSSPLAVKATFSDNTTQDVTAFSTFVSDDVTKAAVGDSGLDNGLVTGVSASTPSATISASYGGKTAPIPATVIVTSRTLQSLNISGSSSVAAGNQVSYALNAVYVDTTNKDVTADAATDWSITPSNVAVLADSVNQPGQIVAVSSGTATLTARFGGKSTTVTIIVP